MQDRGGYLFVGILIRDFFLVFVQQLTEISKLRGLGFSAVRMGKLKFTKWGNFEIEGEKMFFAFHLIYLYYTILESEMQK